MKVRAKGDKPLGKATDSITTGQGALKMGSESLENIILRGKIEDRRDAGWGYVLK